MAKDMSAQRLAAAGAAAGKGYEPQRSANIEIVFDLTTLGVGGGDDELSLALESFVVPATTLAIIELHHLNERRKVAGKVNVDEMTVQFKDYVEPRVSGKLYQWFRKVHDPESGIIGRARDYKTTATVYFYPPDGETSDTRTVVLDGVWPNMLKVPEGDMTSEEKALIEVTFQVDRILYDSSKESGGVGTTWGKI